MWRDGVELDGVVGGRGSRAYFDMAPASGASQQVSGTVVFPGERKGRPFADTPIGIQGPVSGDGCDVRLRAREEDADRSVWQLRIQSEARVEGTRQIAAGRAEPIVFTVVSETRCDGAGEWRTFRSAQWPIVFDYPAAWVLTEDQDDVNVECPSVTALAAGGKWLTFERGQFPPAGADEPYWFFRLPNGEWRVSDAGCRDRAAGRGEAVRCATARRSERNGMTVLQGAAGEHRLYRPGIGYLGPGSGITRYLFVLGDRWVSLDSAAGNQHYGDIGQRGGPALLDGDAVGERVARSVRLR
jgi:hypothetical protein